MRKPTFLLVAIAATSLWANSMCVELCVPCTENNDATCEKVQSLCDCPAIIDSLKAAEVAAAEASKAAEEAAAAKAEAIAASKKQLTLNLLEGCGANVCEKNLYFIDEVFQKSESIESEASASDVDKISLLDAAENLGNTAVSICSGTSGDCTVKLSYESTTMKLVSVQKIEKTDVATTAADSDTESQEIPQTVKTEEVEKESTPKTESSSIYDQYPWLKVDGKQWRLGFSLNYGMGDEVDFWRVKGLSSKNTDEGLSLDAGLGFVFRWYFTPFLSFQTGLSVFFYYVNIYDENFREVQVIYTNNWGNSQTARENIEVDADSWNISSELPLTIRLGIPLGFLQPYASFTHTFRKPYFGSTWMDIEGYYCYKELGSNSGTYAPSDWEFEGWFGIGLELNRFISAEFQWMLYSKVIESERGHKNENYWRTSLQFVW